MRSIRTAFAAFFILFSAGVFAQETEQQTEQTEGGHINENKFRQLYQEFSTPNQYRTGSGAPGPAYYQNEADYKMDIELDDRNQKLTGHETITYHNNSPDDLEYLWVQLDQNIRSKDAVAKLKDGNGISPVAQPGDFVSEYMKEPFDGGFNITEVSADGKPLKTVINNTMMRVDLPQPLKAGEKFTFDIGWWYNINNHITDRARSGYESFEKDGNNAYVIAQFFPRMAVYNDVEGWQNYQFWGNGEFALPFGDYEVNITVPADHILDGTGELVNRKEVFSKEMMRRYEEAKKSYDKPVMIVTQEEAEAAEKGFSDKKKTWKLKAEMVRDFAFATSRKFIWDMMAVDLGEKDVMAVSLYPKEGNPLWEDYSTKVVAHTLKSFSDHTFTYPYPKSISVHAKNQGMEYPMISWNYGRPNEDGTYSDRVKYGMMSVIIHEVGHNFFPMIVNSDERQWGWMDEGLDTFMQYVAEQEYGEKYPEDIAPHTKYPSRRGEPARIVNYMKGDQKYIAPIMSNPENVYQLGNNAYGKPATALNILRETVMGKELFDHAFKTYAQRWMFKHPTPEDFFRTMEDASAVDLDWFWRGWFYSTDFVDIGVEEVKKFHVTDKPTKQGTELLKRYGVEDPSSMDLVYVVEEGSEEFDANMKGKTPAENAPTLNEYMMDNFTPQQRAEMKMPKYFYQVTFNKPGGLIMPVIVEYTYADGTSEKVTYPAQIWRKNDQQVSRALATDKEITKIVVDPDLETADVNVNNNSWPKEAEVDKFQEFKEKNQG
ncbi:M1 family metallopeptidase [Salinimicrobium sediminilitoris]|uniref:M1 family metallopeptidase n=1 Tax=Salinimicrobium sediminilitoris TaxID=2876715 RepID=UPI001E645CB7|nr:M1 family metallopeptidase [Salinimicrobium sediminilitoris]MCC8358432.1 M1 family metallopeptidase [Salinimicrobium sediminilitoris]